MGKKKIHKKLKNPPFLLSSVRPFSSLHRREENPYSPEV
jgi:hypothetical protein